MRIVSVISVLLLLGACGDEAKNISVGLNSANSSQNNTSQNNTSQNNTSQNNTSQNNTSTNNNTANNTSTSNNTANNTTNYDRPEDSRSVLSDDELAAMEALGLAVHQGSDAPDISGTFVMDSLERIVDSRPAFVGLPLCNGEITYTQNGDGTYRSDWVGTSCQGTGMEDPLYVSGSGDGFTLYGIADASFAGCNVEAVSVTSGTLTADGLADYQFTVLARSYDAPACQDQILSGALPPVGEIQIDGETDGLLQRLP